jgi:hypothetical protein
MVPEPYHFRGTGAAAKIIHDHHNEIDPKVEKNLFCIDPIIVAMPYHLSGACAVTRLKLARCDVGVKLLYSCMSIDGLLYNF